MSASTACPICRKPVHERFRPFCSQHCADVDLGRWFTEQYSTPARDGDTDENIDPPPR